MALGSTYQPHNQNQSLDPNYYSRLRIKNNDKLVLNFTYWKGTLKISISEINDNFDGKNMEVASIYLSPTKARILAEGVMKVIDNKDSDSVFGIDTGVGDIRGFIAIGRQMGNPFLFIGKVTADGKYESSKKFMFNVDYNYLLKVVDLKNLRYQKEFMNDVELHQFADLLTDYARSASGALGASFYDIGRYEAARLNNLVKRIANKVGAVDSAPSDSRGNSFFNNSGTKSRYQNIEDLENELG